MQVVSAPPARNAAAPAWDGSGEQATPSSRQPASGYLCPKCGRTFRDGDVIPSHCPSDATPIVLARHWAEQHNDPMVGRTLDDRFTMIAKLGAGSMGAVYRAKQQAMGREVAVKILRSDKALDEAAKARFLREARATSLLASPHTVTVFDFGECPSGELYLAMELLEGESLGQRLTRVKRISAAAAVDTAKQALRSLAEAHAKGIVHRDLKPDNLFYARVTHGGDVEEVVKVLDFGIAKMLGQGGGEINAIETQAGTVFGTPRYMSPEQAQGKSLDGRSDLYSLGVLLYQMLTGRPPFTDDDAIIVMARHIKTAPKPPREAAPDAAIPPELEAVVLRALSKDPTQRPATAEAFSAELTRALEAAPAIVSGVRTSMPAAATLDAPAAPSDDTLSAAAAPAPPRAMWPFALAGAVAVAIVVLAGALLFHRHASSTPSGEPSADTTTTPTTGAASSAPLASNPTSATASAAASGRDDVPTVDVANLPKLPPEPHHGGARPHGTSTGRPKSSASAPVGSAESPGRYGILE